ncbi:MAG: hypothetical protein V3T04_00705 [Dehalococcoidia bacterium]
MASPHAEKIKGKWIHDPELLIEMGLVLTKVSVEAEVNLTQDEKAEVLEILAEAIRTGAVTGI